MAAVVVSTGVVLLTPTTSNAIPEQRSAALQSRLDDLVQSSGVPGAQLVLTENGRDSQMNSGAGDLATGAVFPDSSQVRIASNTKAFVATVILQLVTEQQVELDAAVERYLPGQVYGPGGDGHRITVRNLLQHTSGIPDYLNRLDLTIMATLHSVQPADDLIRLSLDQPSEFAPGTQFGYSNTNYLIAGKVIEQVTGVSVDVEVLRRILGPLDLRNTYWPRFPEEVTIQGPHPRAYHKLGDSRIDVTDLDLGLGLADGALISSGHDLNRFFIALLSGKLLPAPALAEMHQAIPTSDTRYGDRVGLGLFSRITSCGIETWGHGGLTPGFIVTGAATPDNAVTVSLNQVPDQFVLGRHKPDMDRIIDTAVCE
ncbi:serine hydrolase domain-containing protein [Nocardia brasiliensis]